MEQTLLFIGAMLVAFQYVGDIGYASSLFALPFTLPIRPLMTKIGLTVNFALPIKATWEIKTPSQKRVIFYITQVAWWILFILVVTIATIITAVLSPIMMVYFFIGRPLLLINKLLNSLYETSLTPWQDLYSLMMRLSLKRMKINKEFTDKELWEMRKQKGEKPFIAFIGLLFIVAGFILQLL